MNHRSVYVTSACTLAFIFCGPQVVRAAPLTYPVSITGYISPEFLAGSPNEMHLFFGDSNSSSYLTGPSGQFSGSFIEVLPSSGGSFFTKGLQDWVLSFNAWNNVDDTVDVWAADYTANGVTLTNFLANGSTSGGNFAHLGCFTFNPTAVNQPLILNGAVSSTFVFGDPVQPLAGGGLGGTINALVGAPEIDPALSTTPLMLLFGALAAGVRRKRKVRPDLNPED